MDWYYIVLIVLGGVSLVYLLFAIFSISKSVLKAATKPHANTFEETRAVQTAEEGVDYHTFDNVWQRQSFALNGVHGKLRGEVIFNQQQSGSPNKVMVICHGHTANRLNAVKYAHIFYNLGYNVVIYDHGYFGESDGEFTTLGCYERHDLCAVIDFARQTFGDDAILGLHGESMGAVTVLLALELRKDVQFVVADCGFSNTMKYYRQLCRSHVRLPSFPIVDVANLRSKKMYGYDFRKINPIDGVKATNTPICFIHGGADKFILPSHSKDMYAASTNPSSELHIFENATHARSHKADKARYMQVVANFVAKVENNLKSNG